jgi:signal transduction histidine kinase
MLKYQHSILLQWFLALVCCLVRLPLLAQTQTPLILTDQQDRYGLGRVLEYLEDPTGALTFADVTSPAYAGKFKQSHQDVPNLGDTSSAFWVRVRIQNAAHQTTEWRLEFNFPVDAIELYRPRADQAGFEVIRTGQGKPFATREIPYHTFMFALSLPPDADQTIYLRFQDQTTVLLPLTLWSLAAFTRHSQTELLSFGAFYGALFVMLGYNAFLWLALRERSYGYYVSFIAISLLGHFTVDGFADQYFWPNATWLSYPVAFLATIGVNIAGLQFAVVFLGTRTRTPRWHLLISVILAYWGVNLLLFPFVSYRVLFPLMLPVRLIGPAIVIPISFAVWRQGYRPARYFLGAGLLPIVTTLVFLLIRLNAVPSTTITERSYQLGVVLAALLLSLALADRIQTLRQEKETAQNQALTALQAQEQLIREQNVVLEHKVAERTEKLQLYQEHLEERVQEEVSMRQQQADLLIQKSKLESLGLLAAGIAHEINQPLTRITFGADSILLRLVNHEPFEPDFLETKCQVILESIERISHIIDHIRTFSRDQQTLRAEQIDVHATIQNALSLIRTQYQHHNIVIETDLQAVGWVLGNQYQLEQVLLNLLANAKDAIETKAGDIPLAFQEGVITLRTSNNQEQIVIEIADNGVGISEEALPHIFEPFFTTKAIGKGTGLGLSISYGIIKDMHGEIIAASQVNVGTVMQIVLPRIHSRRVADIDETTDPYSGR